MRALSGTLLGTLLGMSSAGLAVALAGCASGPPPPDWSLNAQLALKNFESAHLQGSTRLAEAEFARARSALSATGRPDLVARAELLRCAVRTASLEFDGCPGFAALAADAGPAEAAYAGYLAGRWEGLDATLLPAHHRAVVAGAAMPASVDPSVDPLARLVAAGAALRAGRSEPAGIAAAVEIAAQSGWRRALLAWLGVQAKRADAAGDTESAARVRRRIALVTGP